MTGKRSATDDQALVYGSPEGTTQRAHHASAEGFTLRNMRGVVWRRKWILVTVVGIATGAAYGFARLQPPVYQATASLICETSIDIANPLTGSGVLMAPRGSLSCAVLGPCSTAPISGSAWRGRCRAAGARACRGRRA